MPAVSASNLNVIALISGGKDSFFSLLHCQSNGHTVVALANLCPPSLPGTKSNGVIQTETLPDEDDFNSYMYQTAGHSVIPLYEEALDIPLYRHEISGSAINTERSYAPALDNPSSSEHDETESLIPLLQKVMLAHPGANAVSTGAILSDYQRTRVESVATRLGLVSLSYLWQYPNLPPNSETSLLDHMATVRQESRIIKVASGGLDASNLWENVADESTRQRLITAMGRFGGGKGGAFLGEGGEYETLAIDGPAPLWKKRIVIEEGDMEICKGGGGSALLRIKEAKLIPKVDAPSVDSPYPALIIPYPLDKEFDALLISLRTQQSPGPRLETPELPLDGTHSEEAFGSKISNQDINCPWLLVQDTRLQSLSNLIAPEAGPSAAVQMTAIATIIAAVSPFALEGAVFATILLRSMADFAEVNRLYGALFRNPNPPARVTIACGDTLPHNVEIMISFIFDSGSRDNRKGLHVQSMSYWAPANIGPYSQAISVPMRLNPSASTASLVFVAGQIPLVPASMELVDDSTSVFRRYQVQCVLSLQHLWRIGKAMDVNWWTGGIAFIAGNHAVERKALCAWNSWDEANCPTEGSDSTGEEQQMDMWDRVNGPMRNLSIIREEQPSLPDIGAIDSDSEIEGVRPPFFAVQVHELPRGSDIEWVGQGVAYGSAFVGEYQTGSFTTRYCLIKNVGTSITYVSIPESSPDKNLQEQLLACFEEGARICRLHGNIERTHATVYTARPLSHFDRTNAQFIPCKGLWGPYGEKLALGAVIRREVFQL
ncbi:MAG: hypothetical protein M1827_000692 [Pycnora praestabilis]|nr:MAG: hypothetical protein M1827_000692 [Pycnora praestabilis]